MLADADAEQAVERREDGLDRAPLGGASPGPVGPAAAT